MDERTFTAVSRLRAWVREFGHNHSPVFVQDVSHVVEELIAAAGIPGRQYHDTEFCDHCDKDTRHIVYDSQHERDSSNDWRKCLACNWRWSGLDGEYHAPIESESLPSGEQAQQAR